MLTCLGRQLAALFALLAAASIGAAEPHPSQRLVGGTFTNLDRTAAAFVVWDEGECSGVLAGPSVVVTAAHCIAASRPDARYLARIGGAWHTVAGREFHPGFDPSAPIEAVAAFDIGVLFLSSPVENVAPVPVVFDAPLDAGQDVGILAFGTNETGMTGPGVSKSAIAMIDALFGAGFFVTSLSTSGAAICAGDSGAPAVQFFGEEIGLVGVASAGSTGNLGTFCTSSPGDVSIFVDLQSEAARSFLASVAGIERLSGRLAALSNRAKELAESARRALRRGRDGLTKRARVLARRVASLRELSGAESEEAIERAATSALRAARARSIRRARRRLSLAASALEEIRSIASSLARG